MAEGCQHNRRIKVGEKMENIRREGNAAICNACEKIVATYDVKASSEPRGPHHNPKPLGVVKPPPPPAPPPRR